LTGDRELILLFSEFEGLGTKLHTQNFEIQYPEETFHVNSY
jgi:hypothetical protein